MFTSGALLLLNTECAQVRLAKTILSIVQGHLYNLQPAEVEPSSLFSSPPPYSQGFMNSGKALSYPLHGAFCDCHLTLERCFAERHTLLALCVSTLIFIRITYRQGNEHTFFV